MKRKLILPSLLLLLPLALVFAPTITPPFTGHAPDQFRVSIARPAIRPAGYTFAIWGIIYLWLIVHAPFGLIKRRNRVVWATPRLPLMVAVGLGTV